jgi:excisionase family DNA binding protein
MTTKTEAAALAQLLTLQQSADILNTSLKTLRRRIGAGDLPVIRDGRMLRVHPADLERYISARRSL